jgi:hypothetical protein
MMGGWPVSVSRQYLKLTATHLQVNKASLRQQKLTSPIANWLLARKAMAFRVFSKGETRK